MPIKIALAGNPNSGKTTMFNDLTGSSQYVGNWPGVTVEKKEGKLKGMKDVIVQDLPGIYSLSPYTPEEVVSRNYLVIDKPDVIVNIVDASNIERNLYLTTQLTELGIPVVVALNMIDVVRKSGVKIDLAKLSEEIGCEIVETSAVKGIGSKEVAEKAVATVHKKTATTPKHTFSGVVEHAIAHLEDVVRDKVSTDQLRWYSVKLFERDPKVFEHLGLKRDEIEKIGGIVAECEAELDDDAESIITNERYTYIEKVIARCVDRRKSKASISARVDRVITNRWLELTIFAAIMFLLYFLAVSTIGGFATDWVNDGLFGEIIPPAVEGWLEAVGAAPWLMSLILDGIIGGVGAVLGFLPQMAVLFICLAFLEDCGYMSRIAFIMDRIFRKFGLSGKSFIPIMIGTGCGVPGIMASRTIENENDRRMTVITTTFIPCSAKLPIIALIAGALFADAWWVAPVAYFIGIAAIVCSGVILKKFRAFAGEVSPFVMELPAYHLPRFKGMLITVWERLWSFIKRAGTVIFVSSVIIWFLSSFSWSFEMVDTGESILASIGGAIAWIFTPLGWGEWRSAVATITGLVAKEGVVSTFGILYGFEEVAENGLEYWGALRAAFTPIAAFSFLTFNLLCAPCFAAIGAIRREMASAKWTWFAIGYQTGLAYVAAMAVFQLGSLFTGGGFTVFTAVAIVLVIAFFFLLFRPTPKYEGLTTKRSIEALNH